MKKIKGLLYCTKAKPDLYKTEDTTYPAYPIGYHTDKDLKLKLSNTNELAYLNGTIVAECDFEVEEIEKIYGSNHACFDKDGYFDDYADYVTKSLEETELLKHSCLTSEELENYLQDKNGYALHISNLKIFDKPRELYDCLIHPKIEPRYYGCEHLSKAPQNMMYVELDDIKYILISIKPEWLCKILNGEQTILIKKQVLNCMKGNK